MVVVEMVAGGGMEAGGGSLFWRDEAKFKFEKPKWGY